MSDSLTDLVRKSVSLVGAGGLAARQLESCLAREQLAAGRDAWIAPAVMTRREWATDLWRRHRDDGRVQPLGPEQVDALWRRVIDESDTGLQGLPGFRHASTWAREASQRRREWNIPSARLSEYSDDPDCGALVRWERAYREALRESDWLDPADIVDALVADPPSPASGTEASVVWADLAETPTQSELARRLRIAGFEFSQWEPSRCNRCCRRVLLPEATEEVRIATTWAAGKLARNPDQRVAIVVPGLEALRDDVIALIEESLDHGRPWRDGEDGDSVVVCLQGRAAAIENPVIGAAVNALEMFTDTGDFRVFSRWLRSPFFAAPEDADARCMLEADLRSHICSQMDLVDAYRSGGLARRVRQASPTLADGLAKGLSVLGACSGRETLTGWIPVWRRLLDALGWCGGESTGPEDWESALNELMLLTPILGKMSLGDALVELEHALGRAQRLGAVPHHGIFLLADPEDVGPGYDAVWACGLTDARWPRAPQPVPLLPLALQRAHGMPSASPSAALEQSQTILRRLVDRTPDVVLSSPQVVHDHAVKPSPLILSHPLVKASELVDERKSRRLSGDADGNRLETFADPVPPVADKQVKGGIGVLSMQAKCPLRAFIESRLKARPLEAVRYGVSARQRGIAVHAAARRLFDDLPDHQEVTSWCRDDRSRRIESSCRMALEGIFGQAETPLRALFALELARLNAILNGLLEAERTRTPYRIIATERSVRIGAGGLEFRGRIDRIDELCPDGALAIIDYKTGSTNKPSAWFEERPQDLQMPCYALSLDGDLQAAVLAVLRPRSASYKGYWVADATFPGRTTRLPGGITWSRQLQRWRTQIDDLATEFAEGDGRILRAGIRLADGAMAPLTRIHGYTARSRTTESRVGGGEP